jgi:hypothetical protein
MKRDLHELTARDVSEAVGMWQRGLDTLDIARSLSIPEGVIYGQLWQLRSAVANVRAA